MQLNQYIKLIISPVKFYHSLSVRSLFVESGYHTTYQEACLKLKLVMFLFCSHTSGSVDRKKPQFLKMAFKTLCSMVLLFAQRSFFTGTCSSPHTENLHIEEPGTPLSSGSPISLFNAMLNLFCWPFFSL